MKQKEIEERIEELRTKLKKFEEPINAEISTLLDKLEDIKFEPIIERIKSGEKVGVRTTISSHYYETDFIGTWEENGWDSIEEYIKARNPEWYTFENSKILSLDNPDHYDYHYRKSRNKKDSQ